MSILGDGTQEGQDREDEKNTAKRRKVNTTVVNDCDESTQMDTSVLRAESTEKQSSKEGTTSSIDPKEKERVRMALVR